MYKHVRWPFLVAHTRCLCIHITGKITLVPREIAKKVLLLAHIALAKPHAVLRAVNHARFGLGNINSLTMATAHKRERWKTTGTMVTLDAPTLRPTSMPRARRLGKSCIRQIDEQSWQFMIPSATNPGSSAAIKCLSAPILVLDDSPLRPGAGRA